MKILACIPIRFVKIVVCDASDSSDFLKNCCDLSDSGDSGDLSDFLKIVEKSNVCKTLEEANFYGSLYNL